MTTSTTTHTNGYRHDSDPPLELELNKSRLDKSAGDQAASYYRMHHDLATDKNPALDIAEHRVKLPNGKNSMSDYDLAIAIPLANWGCSDQAIADEIIKHRHYQDNENDLEKAFDSDYMTDLIRRAKTTPARRSTNNRSLYVTDRTAEDFDDTPAYYIFESLGLNIERLVKIVDDDGRGKFHIVTSDGETVFVGGAGVVMSENRFRVAVADAVGVVLKPQPRGVWPSIAQKLFDITETLRPGDPGHPRSQTIADETRGWVRDYFESFKTVRYDDAEDAPSDVGHRFDPFARDGKHHIFITELSAWIADHTGERIAAKVLGPRLREAGFEHDPNCWVDGRRRKVWKVDSRIIGQW